QTALAILDIGFDQITAFPVARMTRIALREFCRDEFLAAVDHNFIPEALSQFVKQRAVAPEKARLQQRSTNRDVLLCKPDTFCNRTRRVTNLQTHIPQHMQDGFDDALIPCGLLE